MVKRCIILGGGPAGTAAALAAARAGAGPVLLVERDALGGTCTNRGCIPTKLFLVRSRILAGAGGKGIPSAAEWGKVIAYKNSLVRGLSKSLETRCLEEGVEIARGSARFVDPHSIEVLQGGGDRAVYEGDRIVIATGSSPAELPGSPSDGVCVITSDQALNLNPLPASLVIIGSGAVGAEFAFIFTRLGVRVTLVEGAPRLFPLEDPAVDVVFRKTYANLGVTVHTGDPVAGIEKRNGGDRVAVVLKSGTVIEGAKALVGVGRKLESAELNCEGAGIEIDGRGAVMVDDDLRTSQPHVFAAGDVTGRMLLAHAASYMGEFAGRGVAGLTFPPVPYRSIPWATFTSPEVGSVGMTLEAAERSGLTATRVALPLMNNIKARIDRETEGFVQLVLEAQSQRIIGGTIVGAHASDLIHIVALAIHQRLTIGDLRGFSFLHPSISESIGDLVSSINTQ